VIGFSGIRSHFRGEALEGFSKPIELAEGTADVGDRHAPVCDVANESLCLEDPHCFPNWGRAGSVAPGDLGLTEPVAHFVVAAKKSFAELPDDNVSLSFESESVFRPLRVPVLPMRSPARLRAPSGTNLNITYNYPPPRTVRLAPRYWASEVRHGVKSLAQGRASPRG